MTLPASIQLITAFALCAIGLWMIAYAAVYLWRTLRQPLDLASATLTALEFDTFDEPPHTTVTLVYAYRAGDAAHTGRHLALDLPGALSEHQRAQIAQYYRVGERLDIYYQRAAPHRSQMDRGRDDALIFAVLVMPVGGALLLAGTRWASSLLAGGEL
jgi:hypothetical protein